jgi:aquaporin Z
MMDCGQSVRSLELVVHHTDTRASAWRARLRDEASMTVDKPMSSPGVLAHEVESFQRAVEDFQDSSQEWRRLFSELLGTFFLVLVAAGGGMMSQAFPGTISRTAAVVAPGLMVLAIILFMGKVSGAHLNPAVSIAFALRRDFPWWRVPGYVVVQLAGAALAAWFLQSVVHVPRPTGRTTLPHTSPAVTPSGWS